MRRRDFVAIIGGAALLTPRHTRAQQPNKIWRIGDVFPSTPKANGSNARDLEHSLAGLGYVQGRNILLSHYFAGPQPEKIRKVIISLLPQIDLLVVWGTVAGVIAKQLNEKLPTVFVLVGAPVEIGLVPSLAHPGGNMTGVTFEAATKTYAKRLQILKEIIPKLERVAVLRAAGDPNVAFAMISINQAARQLGLTLVLVDIKSADDLESAFAKMKNSRVEAVLAIAGGLTFTLGGEIAERCLADQLPLCSAFKQTTIAGGLVSLGPDYPALTRQAARQIAEIIKGASPGDIPVEQPTQYDLYINLKTARLLNLSISPSFTARADQVIE